MDQFEVEVEGVPPAKNEAKSMLAEGHKHSKRVIALLNAARASTCGLELPIFGDGHLVLELTLLSPAAPTGDATNYLGGVGDVLQVKGAHGSVAHLGELAQVAVYSDDKQFQEVHYRWLADPTTRYRVTIRRREAGV